MEDFPERLWEFEEVMERAGERERERESGRERGGALRVPEAAAANLSLISGGSDPESLIKKSSGDSACYTGCSMWLRTTLC